MIFLMFQRFEMYLYICHLPVNHLAHFAFYIEILLKQIKSDPPNGFILWMWSLTSLISNQKASIHLIGFSIEFRMIHLKERFSCFDTHSLFSMVGLIGFQFASVYTHTYYLHTHTHTHICRLTIIIKYSLERKIGESLCFIRRCFFTVAIEQ